MTCDRQPASDRIRGRRHGLIGLALVGAALGLAAMWVAALSRPAALCYLLILSGGGLIILRRFCAQCPSRGADCRHVIPGLLAARLPRRAPGPYRRSDLILTGLALFAMTGFPQPWLWALPALFVLFWLLVAVAAVEILWKVCPTCTNGACPIQPMRCAP